MPPAPSAAKIAAEQRIDLSGVAGSGKRGQVLKGDVLAAAAATAHAPPAPAPQPAPVIAPPAPAPVSVPTARATTPDDSAREERVRMTKLRQTIARRLKDAQNTAAMLTTFNEVDMTEVMAMSDPLQGRLREEAWRQARLHGLLREGLRAGAEGDPGGQRGDRRRGPRLQELLPPRHRGRNGQGPDRAGGARLRSALGRRNREGDRGPRQDAPATASSSSRICRAAPSPSPTAASTAR